MGEGGWVLFSGREPSGFLGPQSNPSSSFIWKRIVNSHQPRAPLPNPSIHHLFIVVPHWGPITPRWGSNANPISSGRVQGLSQGSEPSKTSVWFHGTALVFIQRPEVKMPMGAFGFFKRHPETTLLRNTNPPVFGVRMAPPDGLLRGPGEPLVCRLDRWFWGQFLIWT